MNFVEINIFLLLIIIKHNLPSCVIKPGPQMIFPRLHHTNCTFMYINHLNHFSFDIPINHAYWYFEFKCFPYNSKNAF